MPTQYYTKALQKGVMVMRIEDLLQDGEVIAEYSITGQYIERHCIISLRSDDIHGALEDTLHRILDNKGPEEVYRIMGARIPEDDEWPELEEYDEFVHLDLGYVLDGQIVYFKKLA